jgi:hypothetical protein
MNHLPTLRHPYASFSKESLSPSPQRIGHPAEAFITDLESTEQSPYYSERRKLQTMVPFPFGPNMRPKPPLKKRIVESPRTATTSFERSKKCSRFQNTIQAMPRSSDTACRLLLEEEYIMTTGNEGSDGFAGSQFQNHFPPAPHTEPITSSYSARLIVGQQQPDTKKVGMNYRAMVMDDGTVEARKDAPCQLAEFDVICTRCVMAKKHPGNVYYLKLVRDIYKQKLGTRTTSSTTPFDKVSVDMKRNCLALSLSRHSSSSRSDD